MSYPVALRPMRQVIVETAVASTSRMSQTGLYNQNRCISKRISMMVDNHMNCTRKRDFSVSSSRCRPPPLEPAISRPLDTPPSPIPPPGMQKPTSKLKTPMSVEKEEACSTLSPSSPSAPRTQGSGVSQDKGKAREATSSEIMPSSSPKAIPPEIVNKPSIGRKGSGKGFKAQKAALTLVSNASCSLCKFDAIYTNFSFSPLPLINLLVANGIGAIENIAGFKWWS